MSVNLKPIIVLFLVLGSGAVVFQANSHLTFSILVAIVFLWILASSKVITFNIKYVAVVVTLGIAVFLTMTLNGDHSSYLSYLNFSARILIPFMVPLLISFQHFVKIYLSIIIFLAISSLMIFLLLLVVEPTWYRIFPKTVGLTGLEYFNLFIYVVSDNGQVSRNNSIFWEPGAFQGFLTLGLLFEIYLYKLRRSKNVVILCLASLTTVSTTGYIILLILLTTTFICLKPTKIKKSHLILGLPFVLLCIAFMAPLFFQSIFAKFGENNQSSFIRLSSTIVDLTLFFESAFYGLGLSNYLTKVAETAYQLFFLEMGGSNNSITYHLAVYGVLLVAPLLWMYAKFCSVLTQNTMQAVIIFIIIMITFSTENFLSSLLWLTVGFYGAHSTIKRTHLNVSEFNGTEKELNYG
jgi:hypothetical protein